MEDDNASKTQALWIDLLINYYEQAYADCSTEHEANARFRDVSEENQHAQRMVYTAICGLHRDCYWDHSDFYKMSDAIGDLPFLEMLASNVFLSENFTLLDQGRDKKCSFPQFQRGYRPDSGATVAAQAMWLSTSNYDSAIGAQEATEKEDDVPIVSPQPDISQVGSAVPNTAIDSTGATIDRASEDVGSVIASAIIAAREQEDLHPSPQCEICHDLFELGTIPCFNCQPQFYHGYEKESRQIEWTQAMFAIRSKIGPGVWGEVERHFLFARAAEPPAAMPPPAVSTDFFDWDALNGLD